MANSKRQDHNHSEFGYPTIDMHGIVHSTRLYHSHPDGNTNHIHELIVDEYNRDRYGRKSVKRNDKPILV